jgi:hypothetical protein
MFARYVLDFRPHPVHSVRTMHCDQPFRYLRSGEMIWSQPYRLPTCSGLNETCSAGGSVSESYLLIFPVDLGPYDVVRCRLQSAILYNLLLSFVDDAVMAHPLDAIPEQHIGGDLLDRDESDVC